MFKYLQTLKSLIISVIQLYCMIALGEGMYPFRLSQDTSLFSYCLPVLLSSAEEDIFLEISLHHMYIILQYYLLLTY